VHSLDLAVVVLYFGFTLGVGLWVSRHQRSASDYFLGARNLPAWAILLSIVATETSALTVISIPGIGARGDLTFLQLTVGYLIGRIGVARWLLPGYFRGDQETAYARLESRFGVGTRRLTSLVFLVSRFLGDAVRVFASAIPLALVTGWSVPTAIVVMGIVTMIYTWFGGFKAVVWTDVLQLSVYLAGGVGALLIAWKLGGGASEALARAHDAGKLRLLDLSPSLTHPYLVQRAPGGRAPVGRVARDRPPHRPAAPRHPIPGRRACRARRVGRDGHLPVHLVPAGRLRDLGRWPRTGGHSQRSALPRFRGSAPPGRARGAGDRRHPRRRHGDPQLGDQLPRLLGDP